MYESQQTFLLFKPEVNNFSEEDKAWFWDLVDSDLKVIEKLDKVVLTEELLDALHPDAVDHPDWPAYRDSIKGSESEVWIVAKHTDKKLAYRYWDMGGIIGLYDAARRVAENGRYVQDKREYHNREHVFNKFQKVMYTPRGEIDFHEKIALVMRQLGKQYEESINY